MVKIMALRSLNICKNCIKVQQNHLKYGLLNNVPYCFPAIQKIPEIYSFIPSGVRCLITKVQPFKDEDEGLINTLKWKFRLFIKKNRLSATAFLLYESIVDHINFPSLFRVLNLPDTFYSWFVLTELHIWMLLSRVMVEGEEGRYLRNRIVSSFWNDTEKRSKKLGTSNPSEMKAQMLELTEQFQAAIVAYDEGFLSDDATLAGAIWRRIYQYQDADPENIEKLVQYMRRQMKILDSLSKHDIFEKRNVHWDTTQILKK